MDIAPQEMPMANEMIPAVTKMIAGRRSGVMNPYVTLTT
jgi:hypothetical protein